MCRTRQTFLVGALERDSATRASSHNGVMPHGRRWLAATLAGLLLLAAVPAGARQSDPVVTISGEPSGWKDRARLVMDHDSLASALRDGGYRFASNAEIYMAEVAPGVGQPALVMYDAGQGAFSQNFWPASSVKLLAAVAALEYIGAAGFAGDAEIAGSWIGDRTARSIYESAIVHSDNRSYDLLVRIAGVDFINREFIPRHGLDSATIGSDLSGLSILVSPSYVLTEWVPAEQISAYLPPSVKVVPVRHTVESRRASGYYRSNNIDLFDLAEVVRRVMLADEVAADHRFGLEEEDIAGLSAALCAAEPAHFESGAARVYGEDAVVCGKSGWWEHTVDPEEEEEEEEAPQAPPSCTDVALMSDPDTGRRVLLAATGGCGGAGLAALAAPALEAAAVLFGTPLQADAGVPIDAVLTNGDGWLEVSLETTAQWALVYVDDARPVVAVRRGDRLETSVTLPADGPHLLVVVGVSYGSQVGYRAIDFEVSVP